jgi:hypothetical protein
MDMLKVERSSDSETCHDEDQIINIKVEMTGKQEDMDPLLRTLPVTKTEREVSCMSVCTLLGSLLKYL